MKYLAHNKNILNTNQIMFEWCIMKVDDRINNQIETFKISMPLKRAYCLIFVQI